MMRRWLESEPTLHRCKSSECLNGNEEQRNQLQRRSSARRCSTKRKVTRCGRELWPESMQTGCSLEHHAGTPPTCALKLVISRMVSKSRTRQLASHDVSVAFFHAWLERGVWYSPSPKELRLSDDWLWHVVKALWGMRESSKAFQDVVRDMYVAYEWTLLHTVPCLAYSSRLHALSGWHGDDLCTEFEPETEASSSGQRKASIWTPDAKHVENLASLLEVKGAKSSPTPCSRVTGRVRKSSHKTCRRQARFR